MTKHTAEQVRSLLSYDPLTGIFTWKVRMSPKAPAGGEAGTTLEDGYIAIRIEGKGYKAHILAVLIMTGEWPIDGVDVDHEDRVRSNNRWKNLRQLTKAENLQNHGGPNKNSTTGIRGVSFAWYTPRKKPWIGSVSINRKSVAKHFATKDEAEEWVVSTRKSLHEYCPENKVN